MAIYLDAPDSRLALQIFRKMRIKYPHPQSSLKNIYTYHI